MFRTPGRLPSRKLAEKKASRFLVALMLPICYPQASMDSHNCFLQSTLVFVGGLFEVPCQCVGFLVTSD